LNIKMLVGKKELLCVVFYGTYHEVNDNFAFIVLLVNRSYKVAMGFKC
jgi:hypothetical protein